MRHILIAAILCVATSAWAQQSALELLRQDLKTQKVALLTASLPLTSKEADVFWPIYRDYSNELAKIYDRRIAVLKTVFEKYDTMDAKTAEELVEKSFSIAEDKTSLLEKTYKKVSKQLGPVTAARFMQVENQILLIVEAQVIDQVPLIKTPAEKK